MHVFQYTGTNDTGLNPSFRYCFGFYFKGVYYGYNGREGYIATKEKGSIESTTAGRIKQKRIRAIASYPQME